MEEFVEILESECVGCPLMNPLILIYNSYNWLDKICSPEIITVS